MQKPSKKVIKNYCSQEDKFQLLESTRLRGFVHNRGKNSCHVRLFIYLSLLLFLKIRECRSTDPPSSVCAEGHLDCLPNTIIPDLPTPGHQTRWLHHWWISPLVCKITHKKNKDHQTESQCPLRRSAEVVWFNMNRFSHGYFLRVNTILIIQ